MFFRTHFYPIKKSIKIFNFCFDNTAQFYKFCFISQTKNVEVDKVINF